MTSLLKLAPREEGARHGAVGVAVLMPRNRPGPGELEDLAEGVVDTVVSTSPWPGSTGPCRRTRVRFIDVCTTMFSRCREPTSLKRKYFACAVPPDPRHAPLHSTAGAARWCHRPGSARHADAKPGLVLAIVVDAPRGDDRHLGAAVPGRGEGVLHRRSRRRTRWSS